MPSVTRLTEQQCEELRQAISSIADKVALVFTNVDCSDADEPISGIHLVNHSRHVQLANLTLAFRHLEDARMRLGKVMQACQGGISKYDRP